MKLYALCHQTMKTESLKSPLKGRVLWDESGDTDVRSRLKDRDRTILTLKGKKKINHNWNFVLISGIQLGGGELSRSRTGKGGESLVRLDHVPVLIPCGGQSKNKSPKTRQQKSVFIQHQRIPGSRSKFRTRSEGQQRGCAKPKGEKCGEVDAAATFHQ